MHRSLSDDEARDRAHEYLQADVPPVSFSVEECRAQVPGDELGSHEGRDYVYYFCGADCYQAWRADSVSES